MRLLKLLSLELACFLSLFLVVPAAACEPIADFWFIEDVSLNASELPQGIQVMVADSDQAGLQLGNQTDQPLYVMSLGHRERLVFTGTPDAHYLARLRMAHEAAAYMVAPRSQALKYLNWAALKDLDAALQELNPPTFEPPAPQISLPMPQTSELLLVHGEFVYQVPFTVTYRLNDEFTTNNCPEMFVRQPASTGPEATQPANQIAWWLWLIGLGALVVLLWLLVRRRK